LYSAAEGIDHFKRGDYATPECHYPKSVPPDGLDWEACTSIKWHWGYHATDERWQSARFIVRALVHCASQSGNFLLNVGPTGEGTIPQKSVERLEEVGRWMAVYGESIYGTTGGPFYNVFASDALGSGQDIPQPFNTITDFTRKDGKLFVHVYELPADRTVTIPPLKNKVNGISLLRDPGVKLPYTMRDGSIVATVPASVSPNYADEVLVVSTVGLPEKQGDLTSSGGNVVSGK
jgi:alpha-L-fucosidase